MKITIRLTGVLFGLFGVLFAGPQMARAQQPTDPQGPSAGESSSLEDPAPPQAEQPRYVMLLNSDRTVQLNQKVRHRFLYGINLIEGLDDGIAPGTHPTGVGYTLLSPRVGILGSGRRSQYALQYSPTLAWFSRSAIGARYYHLGSFAARGEITRRWGWDFELSGDYGSSPVSLLGPFRFAPLGNISVVDASTFLLQSTTNRVGATGSIGLSYQASRKNRVNLSTGYTYSGFQKGTFLVSGLPTAASHVHSGVANLGLEHIFSTRWSGMVSLNSSHTFGPTPCTYYGGNVGTAVHVSQRTEAGFSIGPRWGDPACTASRTLAWHAYVTTQIHRAWSAYLIADRSVDTPIHLVSPNGILGSDQISETYVGGIARRAFGERLELRVDTGYLHTLSGNGQANNPFFSAHGEFVSPQAGWALTRSLELMATYRYIYQVTFSGRRARNQAYLSMLWRPEPKALRRQ